MALVNAPGFQAEPPWDYEEEGKRRHVNVVVFSDTPANVMAALNAFLVLLPSTLGAEPFIIAVSQSQPQNNQVCVVLTYGWYA
jgi:hypothetical protein